MYANPKHCYSVYFIIFFNSEDLASGDELDSPKINCFQGKLLEKDEKTVSCYLKHDIYFVI